jgi:hypothetical protein
MLNLNKNVNIGQFSDEIFIEFNLNNFFEIVSNPKYEYYDLEIKRKLYQQKISNVIIYVQLHMKFRYDKDYISFFFNIDDTVFLNLHQNYRISGIHNKKLAQQQIKSFKIIRRVLSLTYEFELPNNINIYPIISIIHLKLISKNSDSYNRSRNDYLTSIKKNL